VSDSSSLDPYRPPETVHQPEPRPDDPEWVGKPGTCKRCKAEFIVEDRYRRDVCDDCNGKSNLRGVFIIGGVFLIWLLFNVLNVLASLARS